MNKLKITGYQKKNNNIVTEGERLGGWRGVNVYVRYGQGGGVRGVLGLIFAGYVPLASQSPYPIIVYSVANCRPHLCHFWANM